MGALLKQWDRYKPPRSIYDGRRERERGRDNSGVQRWGEGWKFGAHPQLAFVPLTTGSLPIDHLDVLDATPRG